MRFVRVWLGGAVRVRQVAVIYVMDVWVMAWQSRYGSERLVRLWVGALSQSGFVELRCGKSSLGGAS